MARMTGQNPGDGTVIPSYLGAESMEGGIAPITFGDTSLHVGEVVAFHPPGTDGNRSGDDAEYTVMVEHRRSNGPVVAMPFRCVVAHGFGGIGDYIRASLRVSDSRDGQGTTEQPSITTGAYVLVACLNGDANSGVILGAMRHPRAPADPGEDDGRHLELQFNGLEVSVNDDGELLVRTNGPTLNDGTPDKENRDKHQKGTFFKFSKNGNWLVSDGADSIELNPAAKTITIKSEGQHNTTCKDSWSVTTDKDVTVEADDRIILAAKGKARLEGEQIRLGSSQADENLVLGQKLVEALNAFVDIWTNNAANVGIGNLGAPVPLFPSIIAQLQAWKLQYTQSLGPLSPAQILASDKFTER